MTTPPPAAPADETRPTVHVDVSDWNSPEDAVYDAPSQTADEQEAAAHAWQQIDSEAIQGAWPSQPDGANVWWADDVRTTAPADHEHASCERLISRLIRERDEARAEVAALRAENDCPHDSLSGDEGPVVDLPGGWPVRRKCDGCDAIVYSDTALAALRTEVAALREQDPPCICRGVANGKPYRTSLGEALAVIDKVRAICDSLEADPYTYGRGPARDLRAALDTKEGGTGTA